MRGFDASASVADRKLLKFANRSHRFALAAAEQAFRDAGIRPTESTRRRWACTVGTGMMGVEFADLVRLHAHSAASGELDTQRLLDDEVARDPMVFCRTQAPAGVALLHAALRHRRLQHLGAHRLRLWRAGDRHGPEAHPAWQRRTTCSPAGSIR